MNLILCSTIAFVIGFLLDLIIGDPPKFPHIVRFFGVVIAFLEKQFYGFKNKKIGGLLTVIFTILICTGIPFCLSFASFKISPFLFIAIESFFCWQCIATKSLKIESKKVYNSLVKNDVLGAKMWLSRIVGRDTENLNESEITRATVETVAENASDGVTAPVIFLAFFGGFGGCFYKSANTMDSMLGYKNEKYKDFGYFPAKFDDFLNYFPSRICAILMIFATKICGFDAKNALKIWKRDRRNHASPNSAQTESVMAGALNLQLAGNATYGGIVHIKPFIGDNNREINAEDILNSHKILTATAILTFVFGLIIRGILYAIL